MKSPSAPRTASLLAFLALCAGACGADTVPPAGWQEARDQLVQRLVRLRPKEDAFGPAFQPLYHAALPWYELWGGRDPAPVDADMVAPEAYAAGLADAMEQGRNFFAENPGSLFPLVFQKTLPGGKAANANYWISLPAGFPSAGRTFPLLVDLHGSGWLGHKLSFKRRSGPPGPMFVVTPIDMAGPWQIDFLNAYLDELLAILPVDRDRVYVQGHSLGAMATWEWALDNPGRFAAISPRAGVGEPYRASRLKYVPSWVIHGENDDVIPTGFADQMVTALQSQGAAVRMTLIKGGEHNMPADLDQGQVIAWYLRQSRSHLPAPEDPRDRLGLNEAGFSPWEIINVPERPSWSSKPVSGAKAQDYRNAMKAFSRQVHGRGELVDSPVRWEMDPQAHLTTFWLAAPATLHPSGQPDPTLIVLPASRYVRFFFRGEIKQALAHADAVRAQAGAGGQRLGDKVWMTPLSIWQDSPEAIAEYWVELK
jgi:pimeloyl-ACP methyl ester carboxylesterase